MCSSSLFSTHSIFLSTLCILISFYHSFSNSFVSLLVRSFSFSSLFHLMLICVHSLSRVHIYSYTIVRFQHVIIDVRARPSYSGFGSSFRSRYRSRSALLSLLLSFAFLVSFLSLQHVFEFRFFFFFPPR